jgi:N6-adenosine-specific RNA methylase IME4
MTIAEICKVPVEAHSRPDAVLFLWVTAPLLLQQPGPREVIEAWGFTPKTGIVWDKVLGNFGHYVHACHEHLIIATRGSCLPDRPTPQPDSVQTIRRGDVHSQKPEEFRKLIEQLYDGPYLELFGSERVEGWSVFGNDARLWAREAGAQDVVMGTGTGGADRGTGTAARVLGA